MFSFSIFRGLYMGVLKNEKERTGKDRRRDDYKSYLYLPFSYPLPYLFLPFTYPLVTPDLKPTGGILGDENKKTGGEAM